MQYVVDLYRRNGRALQRAHQNTAQGVAERQTKAALKRLCNQRRLTRRVVAWLYIKLCRLDQFLPILMDHASLHSCVLSHVLKTHAPEAKMTLWGRAECTAPKSRLLIRGDALVGGSRCVP